MNTEQCTAFQKGPLKTKNKLTKVKRSSFRCRRKTGVPREKPAEASLVWKPNGHTPGPGIEPGLSGPQCEGRGKIVRFAPFQVTHSKSQEIGGTSDYSIGSTFSSQFTPLVILIVADA